MSADDRFKVFIRPLLNESSYRLDQELMNVSLRLVMEGETHVPDTLTRIRVLPTVSVVGQKEKVYRNDQGSAILEVYVKFLPKGATDVKNVVKLAKLIKGLPGVKIVRVLAIAGSPVLFKGEPIII